MGIPVASIIQRAGFYLNDTDHIHWSVTELIGWMNEAAKAVVTRRWDAGAVTENLPLVAGTKQTLAAEIYRIIEITRNMGSGATPGRAVTRADRRLMDTSLPGWHTATAAAETRNWMYDSETSPTIFHVYPPAVAGKSLEAIVSRFPLDVATDQDEIDLDGSFEEAVLNFVLYRCFAKDSEYGDPGKAVAMYDAFRAALGEQVK